MKKRKLVVGSIGVVLLFGVLVATLANMEQGEYEEFPLEFAGWGVENAEGTYNGQSDWPMYYHFTDGLIPSRLEFTVPEGKLIDRIEVYAQQNANGTIPVDRNQVSGERKLPESAYSLQGTSLIFQSDQYFQLVKLYGKSRTNPGHIVWRNSAGTTWQTSFDGTNTYTFSNTGDAGCVVNGISECPGPLPSHIPHYLQDGGRAVTYATRVAQPEEYYFLESEAQYESGIRVESIVANPDSPTIIKEKSIPHTREVVILDAGHGEPGYGMVKVAKFLTKDFNVSGDNDRDSDIDYLDITGVSDPPVSGLTQGRNYFITVNAFWEAATYQYAGKVRVYYKDAAKPNLVAVSVEAKAPLTIQTPIPIEVSFTNHSKPVTKSFNVMLVRGPPVGYSQILHTWRIDPPIEVGEVITRTFHYSFQDFGSAQLSLIVDPDQEIDEETKGDNYATNTFNLVPGKPSGDFDIVPAEITFRDPFKLVPKDIEVGLGCTYQYHVFEKVTGTSWTSGYQTSAQMSFTYPDYPGNLSTGTTQFRMKVVSSCGESDWVTKPLVVNPPAGTNLPPVFEAGWFYSGDQGFNPVHQVVQGSYVDLRIIHKPFLNPPTPYDPEGDPITWHWNFAGSAQAWIRGLPAKHGLSPANEKHSLILADSVGSFNIEVTGSDPFGASTRRTVSLSVVPPEPVPIATCAAPATVKSNRPVPEGMIHANLSYSPYPNRQIDHNKDVWQNKKSVYVNTTGQNITEVITLVSVTDTSGLTSKVQSQCTITVLPDDPPIAQLVVPDLALRNQQVFIRNTSYSQDGDAIVSATYRFKYDAANNGFHDDAWQTISGGNLDGFTFNTTGRRVGKYLFYVEVTEEFDAKGNTSTVAEAQLTLNVISLAPKVSFTIEGLNPQPPLNPPTTYVAGTILNNWNLFQTNTTTAIPNKDKFWSVSNAYLQAGSGKNYGSQQQYHGIEESQLTFHGQYSTYGRSGLLNTVTDSGLGPGGLSPFRAMNSLEISGAFIDPYDDQELWGYEGVLPSSYGTLPADRDMEIPKFRTEDHYLGMVYYRTFDYVYGKANLEKNIYVADINRLSNVIAEPQFDSSIVRYKYRYEYGNPFLYTISNGTARYIREYVSYNNYGYNSDGDYVHFQDITHVYNINEILDYEMVGQHLYVFRGDQPYSYVISYEDGSEVDTGWYRRNNEAPVYSVEIYDIATGSLQRTIQGVAPGQQIFVKGDHLVIYNNGRLTEYDANVQVVRNTNLPAVTIRPIDLPLSRGACTQHRTDRSLLFKDKDNNFYYYESQTCTDSKLAPLENVPVNGHVSLVKLNGDFTLAWKTPLAGAGFSMDLFETHRGTIFPSEATPKYDREANLSFNVGKGTLIVKTYLSSYVIVSWNPTIAGTPTYQEIDLNTGQIIGNFTGGTFTTASTNHHFAWNGNMVRPSSLLNGIVTADGFSTTRVSSGSPVVKNSAGATLATLSHLTDLTYPRQYSQVMYEDYVADGLFLSARTVISVLPGGYSYGSYVVHYYKGPPTTNDLVYPRVMLGQFVSPNALSGDNEITFTMRMRSPAADSAWAGFSFKMTDARNRLAVETDGTNLVLARYNNGSRTVIDTRSFAFGNDVEYPFKIEMVGNNVKVYVNNILYIDRNVTGMSGGRFGPFTDKPYTGFTSVQTKRIVPLSAEWMTNYVVLDDTGTATVRYPEIMYSHPENDPRAGAFQWSFVHTPKFLNNQGVDTTLHNRTLTSEVMTFTRVGIYDITLRAKNDPHPSYRSPSMVFDHYRQTSNPYMQKLIVHRRPVAEFTLSLGTGGVVNWNDTSYDPDRFNRSNGTCSPTENGIDFCATRGVMERKYAYVSPSGQYVEQKLVRPTEAGEYTVYLQVRDEYGAWSYLVERKITATQIPAPNPPPTVQLTYPNGSQANPTHVTVTRPNITWNQNDTTGTVFRGYAVKIMNESGAVVLETGERSQNTTNRTANWTVNQDLTRGEKYQVQVQVSDGESWSAWSNVGWMRINSAPTATITNPDGLTGETPTMIFEELRPTIHWNQVDPEITRFNHFRIEIRNAQGTSVHDTGNVAQNTTNPTRSHRVATNLPTLVPLQARMMVSDGDNLWSDWSNTVWLFLDRKPSANVTAPSSTQMANPTQMGAPPYTIRFNQTDPDAGNVFTKFRIQIVNTSNQVIYDTQEISQNVAGTSSSVEYTIPDHVNLPLGQTLGVRVQVYDGYLWSDWSAVKWMRTGRPPIPDFDWSPKPVWEGDQLMLMNQSTDPDGDALTSKWRIAAPDGQIFTGTTTNMVIPTVIAGEYQVTLTVSDGVHEASITKTVPVRELTIQSDVHHTPEWLKIHQERGHQVSERPKDFYSGEIFIVESFGVEAEITEVQAWIDTVGMDGQPLYIHTILTRDTAWSEGGSSQQAQRFVGELHDDRLISLDQGLPIGLHEIYFQMRYTNGVIKSETVPIHIIHNVNASVGVHRRH